MGMEREERIGVKFRNVGKWLGGYRNGLLLLLLLVIWQSPGLPGWRKVNLITVTHRPHNPSISIKEEGRYIFMKSKIF